VASQLPEEAFDFLPKKANIFSIGATPPLQLAGLMTPVEEQPHILFNRKKFGSNQFNRLQ
jgi:hypothetical protein